MTMPADQDDDMNGKAAGWQEASEAGRVTTTGRQETPEAGRQETPAPDKDDSTSKQSTTDLLNLINAKRQLRHYQM